MTGLFFDTSFLIDFQRERSRGVPGPAHQFIIDHASDPMRLCTVALGEFAEGTQSAEDPVLQAVAGAFELASVDRLTALEYGRLVRSLRSEGRLIGTNDLWIAACALRHDLPLVSANLKHFSRVPGLKLLSY